MGPLFPVCALAVLSSFCLPITAEQAPNRCDGKSMITTKTECKACAFSSTVNCPEGYMKVTNGSGARDCRYVFDLKAYSVHLPGCRHVCVQDFTVPLCCPGYWGPDCLECPGGAAKPCNNRGTCSQGIGGNGTCTCQDRFGGTACETCTEDDVYGEDCRSACNCIHGACNSGINGDGSCNCFSGYRGQRCDELIPECQSLKCPKNSRCVQSSGGALECKCMPSYKGNGRICEPINPCEKSVCDPSAGVCTYLGPNLYHCSCREGYKGDGVVCSPIDPCQENFGGCPAESSLCKYDSPGKSHCTCKEGYNTFIPGVGCSLIDTCAMKNLCSKNANCTTTAPGITVCKCFKGYAGNGFVCYGNLLERMRELNIERGLWQGKLTTAIQFFDAAYAWPLKMQGPFTVLVPANNAFEASLLKIKEKGQYNKEKGQYTAKLHIIAGQLDQQTLKRSKFFYTLTGKSGEVTPGGVISQSKIRLFGSKKSTSILKADIIAYNGFLHIVDKAFDEVEPTLEGNTENTIMDILKANGRYSRFHSLLQGTDVGQRLDSDGPNTVIVPNNIALYQMSSSDQAYLASTQGASKLQELLKYHVVPSVELAVASVVTSRSIMTLANQLIHFNTTSNGLIQVNGYSVIEVDVAAKNGRIYTLDGVLMPPSILPILPQRCDLTNATRIMGSCVTCSLLNRSTCPDDAVPLERYSRDCVYVDQATESIVQMGCRRYCNKTVKVPQCCSGFYGPECLHCPGGFANPCSGNGKCSDGMEGDGLCYCNKGFKGTVCQYCWDLDKYGPNCDKKCPCLHGRCHNVISSEGSCIRGSCKIGYSGNNCDIQTFPCGPHVKYCHAHATCDFSKGIPRCVCNPGYEGDGTTCTEVSACASSNEDACDINAQCIQVSPGVHKCACFNGWAGDGLECSAINNCLLSSYGGCHVNATCINIGPGQNDCRCKEGFRGNGIECQPINTCLSQIEKCHTLATCQLTSSGYWECVCQEGYKGDGALCYGNALNELSSVPEAAGFKGWVMAAPSISDVMSDTANITVLVPSIQAIDSMTQDDRTFWMSKDNIPTLLKNHIFRGIYRSDDLQNTTADMVATYLQSSLLRLSKENGTLTIAGAHIVDEDIAATNGVLHIIDKVLMPLRSLVSPSPDLPDLLTRLGQMPDYSIFRGYIIQYNLAKEIEVSDAYTIFAPNNEAVEKYSHKKGTASLDEDIIKYHIVLGEQLLKNDLHIGMHRETMLGISYQLGFLLHDGQLYANDAPINYTNVATNTGVIHGLTKVIEIQKNRCDVNDSITIQGKCADCVLRKNCPPGTKAIFGPRKSCIYTEYRRGRKMVYVGCLPTCTGTTITKDCCSGFFGPQCLPCPGKFEAPCFGNGICLDSINGTGQCQCEEGFAGTACETCIKGKYGAACKQECSCIHGKCSEGTDGDGSCECDVGWRGVHCDSEIKDDKCNKACHTSANCLEKPDGMAYCKCASGFKGNGSICTAVDACETSNGGCSTYADCKKTTPGNRQCICRSGYAGDGVVCLEINPCTVNNGGCHVTAECTQIGANQSVCNCLKGYSGDGKLCEPINPCRIKRGGCSEFATCNNTGPDERVCTCKASYVGDGFTCRGTIYQELPRNSNTSYFYYKLQSEGVREPQETGPFTVFVPSSEAMKNEPRVSAWAISGVLSQILRYHIVACNQLLVSELALMDTVTSLQGDLIQMANSRAQNSVLLNNQASIISSDIVTSNGIIHVINKVLVPPSLPETQVKRLPKLDNVTVSAEKHGYGTFSKLLQDMDLLSLITDNLHKPVTIFWPSDKTIQLLPQEQRDFLFNKQNKDKLIETLKFHVVRDDKVSAYDLPSKKAMKTLQGSDLSVKCGDKGNGDLFLNDRQCKIVQRQMVFDGGIAYGIDCLLTPNSVGGQCDTLMTSDVFGPCGYCFLAPPCPAGTKPKGGIQKCPYTNSYRRAADGCQRECALVMWIAKCCRGYFGRDCQACPGGPEFPCNSHGVCDDGYTGNGGCICNIGFNGTSCELCVPGRYGPDCKTCDCLEHGQCEDGTTGSGHCICESGWAGRKCETKLAVAPVCSPACSSNAICQENNTCLCKPFYEGDGITCTVVDLCKQNNGGCAQFSKCTQSGVKVSCSCQNGYKGDGYICLPIDPCADGLNGGCHEHAICTMTGPDKRKCDCKDNYLGDGIDCELKMLPIDRCSQDNGQCHADADCADLHFQDTTVGVFHLQSAKGQYKLTYDEANKACINENAKIATYNQLLYAQKAGFHLCSAGWLDSGRVGYPTAFSSTNCGSGFVGIVDYGVRANISEMRDVFCYRMKDVKCTCKFGYVGDGYACSGNLLQVLMSFPMFSNFLSEILQYSNRSTKGQEFVAYLTNLSIQATLFAPNNDVMGDNETLSGRDIEYHLSNISTFFYEDLNNGSQLPTRIGSPLLVTYDTTLESMPKKYANISRLVEGRSILQWDIFASNGIIHVISRPLRAPPEPAAAVHPGVGAVVFFIILAVVALVVFAGYLYCRFSKGNIRFQKFRSNENISVSALDKPSLSNPMYDSSTTSTASAPVPTYDAFSDSDEQQLVTDEPYE